MPGQRLPMRKIRDVLRLSAAGMSSRKIAASLVLGATTVVDCLQRARAAGVSWPLLDDLSDEVLEARLSPASTTLAEIKARRPQPIRQLQEIARCRRKAAHLVVRFRPCGQSRTYDNCVAVNIIDRRTVDVMSSSRTSIQGATGVKPSRGKSTQRALG